MINILCVTERVRVPGLGEGLGGRAGRQGWAAPARAGGAWAMVEASEYKVGPPLIFHWKTNAK